MIDQEVQDFIEHFGKKGMKWGHRKSRSTQEGSNKPKSFVQRHKKGLLVGAAATVAVGAAFAAKSVSRKKRLGQISRVSEQIRSLQKQFDAASSHPRAATRAHAPRLKAQLQFMKQEEARLVMGKDYAKTVMDRLGAIPLGPVGSSGVSRLGGGIPMPKAGS